MNPLPDSSAVCIIVHGLDSANHFLQPWRYVTEVGIQLQRLGYSVTILTDSGTSAFSDVNILGLPVRQLSSIRCFRWLGNQELEAEIARINPKYLIWSMGVTSFLHQQFPRRPTRIQIGIFSSPTYSLGQLRRIGIRKLVRNFTLSGIHILGAMSPRPWLRQNGERFDLTCIVTQTETVKKEILAQFWERGVEVISPGIDQVWLAPHPDRKICRSSLGISSDEFLIAYMGPSDLLRGLPSLVEAVGRVKDRRPEVKLLILNRVNPADLNPSSRRIAKMIRRNGLEDTVTVINGVQEKDKLVELCFAADLIALPFELLPSDGPLSILEARALGRPILSMRLGSIPELCGQGRVYLAEPNRIESIEINIEKAIGDRRFGSDNLSDQDNLPLPNWEGVGREWEKLLRIVK